MCSSAALGGKGSSGVTLVGPVQSGVFQWRRGGRGGGGTETEGRHHEKDLLAVKMRGTHEPRCAGSLWEPEQAKDQIPLSLPEGAAHT